MSDMNSRSLMSYKNFRSLMSYKNFRFLISNKNSSYLPQKSIVLRPRELRGQKSKMADSKKPEFFKIANSQKKIVKISWIGPWVSRID